MNLSVFSKIDEIVDYYSSIKDNYSKHAVDIDNVISELVVKKSMYTLNTTFRIKEASSVREKMIRNSSYRKYGSNEDVLNSFHDIIGIRIECKFIEDESYVYDVVKTSFDKTTDYIFYYNEDFPDVRLKLCEHQPQKQKNGFDIYKIEGQYLINDSIINFELQIKSLVNLFWGDIEHKIIYKNNSYIVMDELVLNNMNSIKENLNLIDKQLHQLYRRYKREDNSNSRMRYKNIDSTMSKMIHDTFAKKMLTDLGFVTDFKAICDSIIQYLLVTSNAENLDDYGKVVLEVFFICNQISKTNIEFNESFDFDQNIDFKNDYFCNTVFKSIISLINCDFQWHIFFLILFNIQRGEIENTLKSYIKYYKGMFVANSSFGLLYKEFSSDIIDIIKKELIEEIADIFKRDSDIQYLCKKGIANINNGLSRVIEEISVKGENNLNWQSMKGVYLSKLNEYIR